MLSLSIFYLRLEFDNEYQKAPVNLKTFIVSAVHVEIFSSPGMKGASAPIMDVLTAYEPHQFNFQKSEPQESVTIIRGDNHRVLASYRFVPL